MTQLFSNLVGQQAPAPGGSPPSSSIDEEIRRVEQDVPQGLDVSPTPTGESPEDRSVVLSALMGGAKGLSLGASNWLLEAAGVDTAAYERANPLASSVGEIGSYLLPFGAGAKLAGLAAKGAAKLGSKLLAKQGAGAATQIAGKIFASKTGQAIARGVTEGGAITLGQTVSDLAQDKNISVSQTVKDAATSMVLGGALPLAGLGISRAYKGISSKVQGSLAKRGLGKTELIVSKIDEELKPLQRDHEALKKIMTPELEAKITERADLQEIYNQATKGRGQILKATKLGPDIASADEISFLRMVADDPRIQEKTLKQFNGLLDAPERRHKQVQRYITRFWNGHLLKDSPQATATSKAIYGKRASDKARYYAGRPDTPQELKDTFTKVINGDPSYKGSTLEALFDEAENALGRGKWREKEAAIQQFALQHGDELRKTTKVELDEVKNKVKALDLDIETMTGGFRPEGKKQIHEISDHIDDLTAKKDKVIEAGHAKAAQSSNLLNTVLTSGVYSASSALGLGGIGSTLSTIFVAPAIARAASSPGVLALQASLLKGATKAATSVGKTAGNAIKYGAYKMLSEQEMHEIADSAESQSPEKVFDLALSGATQGGMDPESAEKYAAYQAARLSLVQEAYPSGSSMEERVRYSQLISALEDPQGAVDRYASGNPTPSDIKVLQKLYPEAKVLLDSRLSQVESRNLGSLARAKQRGNITEHRARQAMNLQKALASAPEEKPRKSLGTMSTKSIPLTPMERLQRQGGQ